jgi:hypothetical protein
LEEEDKVLRSRLNLQNCPRLEFEKLLGPTTILGGLVPFFCHWEPVTREPPPSQHLPCPLVAVPLLSTALSFLSSRAKRGICGFTFISRQGREREPWTLDLARVAKTSRPYASTSIAPLGEVSPRCTSTACSKDPATASATVTATSAPSFWRSGSPWIKMVFIPNRRPA